MASQGPNGAGTGAGGSWTNPGNITADDASFATLNFTGTPTYPTTALKATNFGFSIPSGATINGIVVEWKRKVNTTTNSPRDNHIYIVKGGTTQTTQDKASASTWPTTEAFATYGTSSDLWGVSWTDTDINSSGFGSELSVKANAGKGSKTASVNYCRITVYYTDSGGGATVASRLLLLGVG